MMGLVTTVQPNAATQCSSIIVFIILQILCIPLAITGAI